MSVSGKYNDESFALACEERTVTVGKSGSHIVKCRGDARGGELVVELDLDPQCGASDVRVHARVPKAHGSAKIG